MSAHKQCIFYPEAVTWKTRLLPGYLANMESKQGEAKLKTYSVHETEAHLPTTGTAQPPESMMTLPSPSCSG